MPQPCVTLPIVGRVLRMLSSVELDDHSFFQADEVNDVTAQRLLPPKFVAADLPQAQMSP